MNENILDVTESINNEIKTNSVVLYMKGSVAFPMCGFSAATVQILTEEFIGGCDIVKEMYESGELLELLKSKGIEVNPS